MILFHFKLENTHKRRMVVYRVDEQWLNGVDLDRKTNVKWKYVTIFSTKGPSLCPKISLYFYPITVTVPTDTSPFFSFSL